MNANSKGADGPAEPLQSPNWELRPADRKLLVNGRPAAIGSRAFNVLVALDGRRGEVVSKAALIDMAWNGRVVEENNLSVQIAALRKTIGSNAIQTVPGLGYCLATALPSRSGPVASASGDPVEFLGRDADIEWLGDKLRRTRLVTVVGTGGVGKTSLARVVLARREAWSTEESFWVDLAPVQGERQFFQALAKVLGIELGGGGDTSGVLLAGLRHARGVIVLDNCEHLVDAAAGLVRQAIESDSGARWLVTSQVPLGIRTEAVYRLGPLDVPGANVTLEEAMEYSAVALLCQRAAAADRHFQLDQTLLPLAVALCRHLDGLPLAIEMAATRVASFGLQGVFDRLGNHLKLLTGANGVPPRHLSLQSTLDWSHDLLSELEKKIFRRLGTFVDGFSIGLALGAIVDAADSPDDNAGVAEGQALDALDGLVHKSLIHRSKERGDRLFLYESARDYARMRLAGCGETELARHRHAWAVVQWFEDAQADLRTMNDRRWSHRYVVERLNVVAGLDWACEARDPIVFAKLTTALASMDAFMVTQAQVLTFQLPLDLLDQLPAPTRAVTQMALSWAHYSDGNRETGTQLAQRALDAFSALGNLEGRYQALAILIRLCESRPGLSVRARELWDAFCQIDDQDLPLRTRLFCAIQAGLQHGAGRNVQSLSELERIATGAGFAALAAICRAHITDELLIRGAFQEVLAVSQRFLLDELPPRPRAAVLRNRVLALVRLGRAHEAKEPARSSLRIAPNGLQAVIDAFALAASMAGRHVDAAVLYGFGARVRRDRDRLADPAEARAISDTWATMTEAMDAERVEALMRMGAAMSSSEVLAMAMSD